MSNEKSAAQLAVAQTGPQGLLSTEQMGRVQGAITDLQPQQLIWLSGYFRKRVMPAVLLSVYTPT